MKPLKQLTDRWHGILPLAVAMAVCVGCGARGISVEGNITWNGKPAESGTIDFAPIDGQGRSAGGAIENGKYRLSSDSAVAPGKKSVNIFVVRKTGKKIESGPPSPPGTMVDEIETANATETCEIGTDGPTRLDFNVGQR